MAKNDVTIRSGNMEGGVLGELSREWASRPADQRIVGKDSWDARMNLQKAAEEHWRNSTAATLNTHAIEVRPYGDRGIVVTGQKGNLAALTHWATTQICQRASVPAGYLRDHLIENPKLAAECLNYGLRKRADESVGMLLTNRAGALQIEAVTGKDYGRIWNKDIVQSVNKHMGPEWTVPGIFGKKVNEITKENTSLFLSSQDMFFGLTDEEHKIEVPNRRGGKPGLLSRGVLIGNSEVGTRKLTMWAFMFDYACANRNFWGVEGFVEINIRHSSRAPDRWLYEAAPVIRKFLNSSTAPAIEVYKLAQHTKVEDPFKFLTDRKFTKPAAKAIIEVHQREEQRPIETLWDANVGATAYARDLPWQDQRVEIERMAAAFMPKAKA